MVALFGQAFVDQTEQRGAGWHLRRLDRREFRAVLDELASIPAHGRDRQRYCRVVIQDEAPLAGAMCLFLLDPESWNDAALEAQMRALPGKRRRRRAPASSASSASPSKPSAPASTTPDDPLSGSADGGTAGDGEDSSTDDDDGQNRSGDIKPVRQRRFQQRLEARRRRRKADKE